MKRIILFVFAFVVMLSGCSSQSGPSKKEMSEKESDLLLAMIQEKLSKTQIFTVSAEKITIIEHVSYLDFTKKMQIHEYGGYVPIRVSMMSETTGKEINPVLNIYFHFATQESLKADASDPKFVPGEYRVAHFSGEGITEQGVRPEEDAKIKAKISLLMKNAVQLAEKVAQK